MTVEGGGGHVHAPGQLFHIYGICIMFPQPGNGLGYLIGLGAGGAEQPQASALIAAEQIVMDFPKNHGNHNRNS